MKNIRLIPDLFASVNKKLEMNELYEICSDINFTLYDFTGLTDQTLDEPYSRLILSQNQYIEIMVAKWRPHASCLPHDHAKSIGLVYVVSGECANVIYHYEQKDLYRLSGRKYSSGDFIAEPMNVIHSMENRSSYPMITVHFYSPAIHHMKIYDRDEKKIITVGDNCGAWYPSESQMIVSRVNF